MVARACIVFIAWLCLSAPYARTLVIPYTEGLKSAGGLSSLVAYFPFENGAHGYRYSNSTRHLPLRSQFSPMLSSQIELAATSQVQNAVETRSAFQGHAMYFDSASRIKVTVDENTLSHHLSPHITMAAWINLIPSSKGVTDSPRFM
eukprot:gb/GECG01003659.1/.p1 GENE.gb/GECG01003659.1/~~gb/GECG01003659.1/.p1  ORF type:complete len:147 (+),score=9.26 gb/GECG01003659.1/:1-441(+)